MTNALASMRFEPDKVTKLKDVGKSSNALLKRRKKWSSTRKECTVHVKTSSIWKKQMSNKGRPFSFLIRAENIPKKHTYYIAS